MVTELAEEAAKVLGVGVFPPARQFLETLAMRTLLDIVNARKARRGTLRRSALN